MSRSPAATLFLRLAIELSFWALPVAFFFAIYLTRFAAPASALSAHLSLLAAAWTAVLALRLLAWRTAPAGAARWLSAGVLAVAWVGLLLYYALVLVGLYSWGRVITWRLISTYAAQLDSLLDALDVSGAVQWAGLLGLLAAFCVIVVLAARLEWMGLARQRLSAPFAWALVLCGLFYPAVRLYDFSTAPQVAAQEPLGLTFFPEQGARFLQNHAYTTTLALDRAEALSRERYRPEPRADRRNVVLIVGDALRPDHMGVYGYARPTTPHLQALMTAGRVARASRMASVCAESSCGLFAIARSRYVHEFSSRPFVLPEVLRLHGYRIHMILGGDHTNFYGLREAYGNVDSYYDGASSRGHYMNDDQLVIDRVRAMPPSDGNPIFLQIHLMSAHPLGRRHDRFLQFLPSQSYAKKFAQSADPDPASTNYYDNGVLQLDDAVDQITAALAAKGYLDSAIVVVTADHGEMLGEHREFMHAKSVFQPALDIPMLLVDYGPAPLAQFPADVFASQVDIAPTILYALGMPAPQSWTGRALQNYVQRDFIYFREGTQVGLIDLRDAGRYKYWSDLNTKKEFAFDLVNDAAEQVDIMSSAPSERVNAWRIHTLESAAAVIAQEQ